MKSFKKNKIAIIGAGYVGLDLAVAFSKKFSVVCFDIDKNRIKNLKNGIDLNQQCLKKNIINKNLYYSSDENSLKNNDIYIITVPTPINKSKLPNLSMLKDASNIVGKFIKKKSIIIYESTTFPGCTEEICIPIIEKISRLKFKKDFYVAYSPERVNPGDKVYTINNITKVVGANDNNTLLKVKNLYNKICKSIYPVKSIKVAESSKVIENIQRDINIALVNELAILFNKLNIPTNEVLKAANTKWNFHYYKPGLVGGHCISVDPYYLAYKAKQKNYFPKVILSGRNLNESMGTYVAKKTLKIINTNNIETKKIRIAILGFAFKDNIPDIRNTKVAQITNVFNKLGIRYDVIDPIVSKKEVLKYYSIKVKNFDYLKKFKYDAIILAVSHSLFLNKLNFFSKLFKNQKKKIFIDIKNNYPSFQLKKHGFIFFQL